MGFNSYSLIWFHSFNLYGFCKIKLSDITKVVSKQLAARNIAYQIIAPRTIAPLDDCPLIIAHWTIAPDDNCHPGKLPSG